MKSIFVSNPEQAKEEILKGNVVFGDRNIGKTLAIMEVIHEKYHGAAVVVTVNRQLAEHFQNRYAAMFPEDRIIFKTRSMGITTLPTSGILPLVFTFYQVARNSVLRGRDLPVFVDCWNSCPDDLQPDIYREFNGIQNFAGGSQ